MKACLISAWKVKGQFGKWHGLKEEIKFLLFLTEGWLATEQVFHIALGVVVNR